MRYPPRPGLEWLPVKRRMMICAAQVLYLLGGRNLIGGW
jgi:hypothetical protein